MTDLAGARLVRARHESGRVCVGVAIGDELRVLGTDDIVATLQEGELGDAVDTVPIQDAATLALSESWTVLAPVTAPETWAAGVTYEHSRDARMHESQGMDVYDRVYEAERPELFLKDAAGRRTVGPGEPIAARGDASWTVPEPELAVVLGDGGVPLGVTIGNDVSSRDIEGANPLFICRRRRSTRARARSVRRCSSCSTGVARSRSKCGSWIPRASLCSRTRPRRRTCADRSPS